MIKATLVKEIDVDTQNAVGIAAKVTQLVAKEAKANIRAVWAEGMDGKGHFGLITDNNVKALEALKKAFPQSKEKEILLIDAPNQQGELAVLTDELSKANLNIEFFYTTMYDNHPAIVLSTNDNKKALGVINH